MTPTYAIVGQVQLNKWIPEMQQAVEGWDVTVQWATPSTVFHVFVKDADYNPTNVDAAIRDAGSKVMAVAALGQSSATPTTPAA